MSDIKAGVSLLDFLRDMADPQERVALDMLLKRQSQDPPGLVPLQALVQRSFAWLRRGGYDIIALVSAQSGVPSREEIDPALFSQMTLQLPEFTLASGDRTYMDVRINQLARCPDDHDQAGGTPCPVLPVEGMELIEAIRALGSMGELAELDRFHDARRSPVASVIGAPTAYEFHHDAWIARLKPLRQRLMQRLDSGEWFITALETPLTLASKPIRIERSLLPELAFEYADSEAWLGPKQVIQIRAFQKELAEPVPRLIWKHGCPGGESNPPETLVESSVQPTNIFRCAPDYLAVWLGHEEFRLGPKQALVVRILHEASATSNPWLSWESFSKRGIKSRIPDLFKSQPNWNDLIQWESGRFRLNLAGANKPSSILKNHLSS